MNEFYKINIIHKIAQNCLGILQQIFILEKRLSNFGYKNNFDFLNDFWATLWEIVGNFLGYIEQFGESPKHQCK